MRLVVDIYLAHKRVPGNLIVIAPFEGIGQPVLSVTIRSLVRFTIPPTKLAVKVVRTDGVYVSDAIELEPETSLPIVPVNGEVVRADEGLTILLRKRSTSLILSMPLKSPLTVKMFVLRVHVYPVTGLKFTRMESHDTPVS